MLCRLFTKEIISLAVCHTHYAIHLLGRLLLSIAMLLLILRETRLRRIVHTHFTSPIIRISTTLHVPSNRQTYTISFTFALISFQLSNSVNGTSSFTQYVTKSIPFFANNRSVSLAALKSLTPSPA